MSTSFRLNRRHESAGHGSTAMMVAVRLGPRRRSAFLVDQVFGVGDPSFDAATL